MTTQKQVEAYFNDIAADYKSKYSAADAFRSYFFNERLVEATEGFDFEGKKILDIGAGTGNLYDRLLSIDESIDYYASDVAAGMLEKSNIPEDRRFVGDCYEIRYPVERFDYVFLLGVTTYMSDEALARIFDFIHSVIEPSGKVIVTFTNRDSIDWKTRKTAKLLLRNFASGRQVLSQRFEIHPRNLTGVTKQLQPRFSVDEVRWLNHTVFPFCEIFKNLSVSAARKIHSKVENRSIRNRLSSDFLLVLSKKPQPVSHERD